MADQRKPLPFEPRSSADEASKNAKGTSKAKTQPIPKAVACLLYTSDAADE